MMTSDPIALNFIFTSSKFQKPSDFEYILSQLVGPGKRVNVIVVLL
jgi:hypothetical protein